MSRTPPEAPEVPLPGGLVDRVVRVGDTVRRPTGPWTPAVQGLLAHLAKSGFPAPRSLGIDEQGREIVSFVEGRPCLWPWPEALLEEDGVREVGRFVRRFHEAVAGYRPAGTPRWQRGARAVLPGELVCHGDLNASNVLWGAGGPCGLVDWESAYPGWPVTDLAAAAWSLCPLGEDAPPEAMGFRAPPDRARRLRALVAGYGDVELGTVLTEAHRLALEREALIERLGSLGVEPWRGYRERALGERVRAGRLWLEANMGAVGALGAGG